jgi:hypothetical protein
LEAEAEVETETEACIGGGGGRCGTLEAVVEAAETVEVEAVDMEAVEAKGCIGGGGMHWKHWNASEVHRDRADRAGSEYKVSEAVKQSELVRTR